VSAATDLADLFRRPPTTGALRIDPLTGTRPTWRTGDAPIFDRLVEELGDPYLPGPPPTVEDDAEVEETSSLDHLVETLRAVDLADHADRIATALGDAR
jgi:hypothetical protein